jgi:hypothetical protein
VLHTTGGGRALRLALLDCRALAVRGSGSGSESESGVCMLHTMHCTALLHYNTLPSDLLSTFVLRACVFAVALVLPGVRLECGCEAGVWV